MWPFLCSDRVPLCPLSGELLSQMDIGLFLKLSLHLLRSMGLWILINSCITWMNPTWSCCVVLLMSCWTWFATVWLRILCLCSSLIFPCNFLFWWYIFSACGIRVMVASSDEFEEYSIICKFLEWFQKDTYWLFTKCLTEFACEVLVLAFCFLENFKSEFQFQYIWCVSLYFLFLSGSYLENCTTLYEGQEATVRNGNETRDFFQIG